MDLRDIGDDFFRIGNAAILYRTIQNSSYDFAFRRYFDCRSIVTETDAPVLLHIGAIDDYGGIEKAALSMGMKLLMTADEHDRCSMIERWYPLLAERTPYTKVFRVLPPLEELLADFSFPVFIKGNRQTSRHDRAKCIIASPADYESLRTEWKRDEILSWQKAAVREYVPLQALDVEPYPNQVPISFEFRFFFFAGQCVGHGAYWHTERGYVLPPEEQLQALSLAKWAADRIGVSFITVDLAKTQSGEWIIIEVNDAQESGFAEMNPISLWSRTIAAMQNRTEKA